MVPPTDVLFQQAFALHRQGHLGQALALYAQVLATQPGHAAAFLNTGLALYALGRFDEALASYDRAIAIQPEFPQVFFNRGNVLRELGRPQEAIASYDQAIEIKPDYVEAFNNRGVVLMALGRLDESLASYAEAIAIKPDHASAFCNRGNTLRELRRLDDAVADYDKAIAIKPDYAIAFNNRGRALSELGRQDEAVADYDRAIAIKPDYASAFNNRGHALQELARLEDAVASYDQALAIQPDHDFLFGLRISVESLLCDWRRLAADLSRLQAQIALGKKVSAPFPAIALTDQPELHFLAARAYTESVCPADDALGGFTARKRDGKIRIGYYSADFREHPISYLTAQLFESHDRRSFELYGFSFGRADKDDAMRQRISAGFDHFIDVAGKSDREVTRLSRDLGIDIAVDLNGFTHGSRPAIFAARCAPVQVNFQGYPGTMGASYIDYLIADKTLIPESDQVHYAEKIVYLPHSYQVNDATRKISERIFTRQELGLPDDSFVFCCFNNNYKIQPAMFDSWMRILKSIDGSVLWLRQDNPGAAANLRKEAEARGVESDRLVFAHRMKQLDEHLARHRLADLFLDTLPYNAHTTASDALWTGLPVLTCMGRSFAARVAASLLNAIDLPELITHSYEAYEAKAIELARNPALLHEIRTKLARNRLSSPLFDGQLFARHIEAAYTAMHERHQTGLAPAHIKIDATKS